MHGSAKNWLRFISAFVMFAMMTGVCLAVWTNAVWPQVQETAVTQRGKLTLDASDAANGYIACRGNATNKRLKLRITYGENVLTYDINSDGEYEIFPLQFGSGTYNVNLYTNTSGKKYAADGEIKFSITLNREDAAFLVPTQYVSYSQDSKVVALSDEVCRDCTTDAEKLEAVRKWIRANILYDYVKAVTVSTGTLPDIDYTLNNGMGICQDIAALSAAMLRVQGIPCKMVIGYLDDNYHAWNSVYIDGEYKLYDPTLEVTSGKSTKYTVERYY